MQEILASHVLTSSERPALLPLIMHCHPVAQKNCTEKNEKSSPHYALSPRLPLKMCRKMKITWGCGKIIQDNRIIIENFTCKCTTQIANRIKTGWWKKCKTIWRQQFGGNKAKLTSGRLSTWFSVFADSHFSNWFVRSLCLWISRGIWGVGVASLVELSPSLSETNWTRLQPESCTAHHHSK